MSTEGQISIVPSLEDILAPFLISVAQKEFSSEDVSKLVVLLRTYFAQMLERFPISVNEPQCDVDQNNRCLFRLEQQCFEDAALLSFTILEADINSEHKKRLQDVWNNVCQTIAAWHESVVNLKLKWSKAAELEMPENPCGFEGIPQDFVPVIKAITARVGSLLNTNFKALREWQLDEKNARLGLYGLDRNAFAIYMAYIKLLVERPRESAVSHTAIFSSENLELVKQAKLTFLRLKVADTFRQCLPIARAYHHEQKDEPNVRKSGEAYIQHPARSARMMICEVIVNDILANLEQSSDDFDEDKIAADLVLFICTVLLHDVGEDSGLNIEAVIDKLIERANHIDTGLFGSLMSGFATCDEQTTKDYGRTYLRQNSLDCISSRNRGRLITALKGLTEGAESAYSDTVRKQVILSNPFGISATLEILGLDASFFEKCGAIFPRNKNRVENFSEEPSLQCAKRYPNRSEIDPEKKMDRFLIRLIATSDQKTKFAILIGKMADRIDNLDTLSVKSRYSQLQTLRETVTRLIGYIILDYQDNTRFSLNKLLVILIDSTLKEYSRFVQETADGSWQPDAVIDSQIIAVQCNTDLSPKEKETQIKKLQSQKVLVTHFDYQLITQLEEWKVSLLQSK